MRFSFTPLDMIRSSQRCQVLSQAVALLVAFFICNPSIADDKSSEGSAACVNVPERDPYKNVYYLEMVSKNGAKMEYQRHKDPELLPDVCAFHKAKRNWLRENQCWYWITGHAGVGTQYFDAHNSDPENPLFTREQAESKFVNRWEDPSTLPAEVQIGKECIAMAYGGMSFDAIMAAMFCQCWSLPVRQVVPERGYYPDYCPVP